MVIYNCPLVQERNIGEAKNRERTRLANNCKAAIENRNIWLPPVTNSITASQIICAQPQRLRHKKTRPGKKTFHQGGLYKD